MRISCNTKTCERVVSDFDDKTKTKNKKSTRGSSLFHRLYLPGINYLKFPYIDNRYSSRYQLKPIHYTTEMKGEFL